MCAVRKEDHRAQERQGQVDGQALSQRGPSQAIPVVRLALDDTLRILTARQMA